MFITPMVMNAQVATVSGPDGKLKVNVDVKSGKAVYDVTYEGKRILDESPLGLKSSIGDFSSGMTFKEQQTSAIDETYTLDRSKVKDVHYVANELKVLLQNERRQFITVNFHVSNNDIAFRYEIPQCPDKANEKKASIRVFSETSGFDFPDQTTTFLSPQSDAMIGWKATKPSYEEEYAFDAPMGVKHQFNHGFTFPCLFHVNAVDGAKKGTPEARDAWVLVSETGVDSHYCGSHLSEMKENGLYTIAFPMPEENNGNGTVEPAFALPGNTPWRTITVGSTLKPIVETTAPWDNVKPLYTTDKTYKYGRGTWSWIVWQDNSINYDDQVRYIQLAKSMGYEYVLIDNWWDNNIGYERIEQLIRYAQSQGVDVFLWHSSSGYWNDIEQGPINKMDNPIIRKQQMRWMKQLGVKGIKVDFFGGDKQETMRLYEEILSDADDAGLMVIFHGCTIPRGWERMYPNYVGSEAVLASENLYFSQHFCDVEAQNTALHPFCRNAIGCMEFGGCFMNRHIHKGNKGGNTRKTTDCHELATCILFQNPIQNFAITPENLTTDSNRHLEPNAEGAPAPEISMSLLREMPTTWDETRYVDGYPGKYCVMARRHGDTWYIAGNNATSADLRLKLNLPMIPKGTEATLYSDDLKTREPQLSTFKISNPSSVTITMAANGGGFVAITKK